MRVEKTRLCGTSATTSMAAASALLADGGSSPEQIEAALSAVLADSATDDFSRAFGPRRLMKRLAKGDLSERAMELADELLAGGSVNLASDQDYSALHREELHPDDLLPLASPPPPPLPEDAPSCWWLNLAMVAGTRAALVPSVACQLRFEPPTNTDDTEPPILRLVQLSRRERLGSEIQCKIWPAAAMLGRWLWRHRRLVSGQTVLELGAGVGTAGLAAAACGASRVVLTDINEAALRCARANCTRNGDVVQSVAAVAHLDWARPPMLDAADEAEAHADEEGVAALLRKPFDILLAADVVNDEGLSEMVFRVLQLYLAPKGLFIMCCPKARHRHCVDRLRSMLVEATELSVSVSDVPDWMVAGLDEAVVVQHELLLAQWR
jgi:predicted nicotinamide N-methyase